MNIGVIFAGGSGKRMHTKGMPKQFLEVNGKPVIIHTLEHFETCPDIDAVVIACLKAYGNYLDTLIRKYGIKKVKKIVPGGESGQESIYNGLCAAREVDSGEDVLVLIHDGVRPLITPELLSENIRKARKKGNAVTVAPAVETIIQYEKESDLLLHIMDRSTCFVAKAPQTFRLQEILAAHEKARKEGEEFIDSVSMMQHYGHTIHVVESTPDNIKITTPSDFYMLKAILQEKEHSLIFGL